MTEMQLREILCDAMIKEYEWIPALENLRHDYTFSPEFEKKIKKMMQKYGSGIKQNTSAFQMHAGQQYKPEYVRIGRYAIRKLTVVILAAVMMLALAACAVYFGIQWHETENAQTGTLDVTFDADASYHTQNLFEKKRPETPKRFEIVSEYENSELYRVSYKGEGEERIDYVQERNLDTMGISIDKDDESFKEIIINGYKGYAVTEEASPYITWADDKYLYYLAGNVPYEALRKMAESIE